MRLVSAFLCGGLFGAGLLVSGMTDTTKVIGWLDIFGDWDPTLAFVLFSAIVPMTVAWQIAARRSAAVYGGTLTPPPCATPTARWCSARSPSVSAGGLRAFAPARRSPS